MRKKCGDHPSSDRSSWENGAALDRAMVCKEDSHVEFQPGGAHSGHAGMSPTAIITPTDNRDDKEAARRLGVTASTLQRTNSLSGVSVPPRDSVSREPEQPAPRLRAQGAPGGEVSEEQWDQMLD